MRRSWLLKEPTLLFFVLGLALGWLAGCEALPTPPSSDRALQAVASVAVARPEGAATTTLDLQLTVGLPSGASAGAARVLIALDQTVPSEVQLVPLPGRATAVVRIRSPRLLEVGLLSAAPGDEGALAVTLRMEGSATGDLRAHVARVERAWLVAGTVWRDTGAGAARAAWPRDRARFPAVLGAAPSGRSYGDITNDGAIDMADALVVLSWAAGLLPAPLVGSMDEVVGNVFPANSGVGGGPGDPDGPGWAPDCTRDVNMTDASSILYFAAGFPVAVIGQPVPGDWMDPATQAPWLSARCQP